MNKVINGVLAIALCFLFLGCGKSNTDNEAKREKPIPVETARSYRGDIKSTYSGSTALEAENDAAVIAKVNGIAEKILVEEGDQVKAGALLALIEPEQYRLRMEQARASMIKLEKEYERSRSLHAENIVSKESFDRIRYDFENQKASYELSHYELTQTRIVSPIEGVITQRQIKIGSQVQTGQSLFHIADFSPILGVLHVPEKELGRMKIGLEAEISPDAVLGAQITGFIKLINPVINPQTGTGKITIEINDRDALLKPGMFVRVQIITDTHHNALLIPRDALISEDTERYAFITETVDGRTRVKKQVVKTAYASIEAVEIIAGLSDGNTVVTIGHNTLKDGSLVDVIQDEKSN